jgi:crotonobetainyl-CoA:carnitine CoA-transferase CaiB-like acyl-CoA transferase
VTENSSLLDGITVLDFTRVLAGPYATRLLADLGAHVIKVERPGEGDEMRRGYLQLEEGRTDQSTYFTRINAGKLSIAIDLARAESRPVVADLARRADVVVENFVPGVVDRLGCDYTTLAALNPDLVYCSISGFGQTGPLRGWPAFAHIINAVSGIMDLERDPDPAPRVGYLQSADVLAGTHAFGAIVSGLLRRFRTGQGAHLDVSMMEALVAADDLNYGAILNGGEALRGPRSGMVVHRIGGRWIAMQTVGAPQLWPRLLKVMARPELADDPRPHADPAAPALGPAASAHHRLARHVPHGRRGARRAQRSAAAVRARALPRGRRRASASGRPAVLSGGATSRPGQRAHHRGAVPRGRGPGRARRSRAVPRRRALTARALRDPRVFRRAHRRAAWQRHRRESLIGGERSIKAADLERRRDRRFRRLPSLRVGGDASADAFVAAVGFCSTFYRFPEGVACLWEAVAGRRDPRWPRRSHHDAGIGLTWELKDRLPAKRRVYYGKLLRGKPLLVALDVFPAFYALVRGRQRARDYRAEYEAGRLGVTAKRIMDALVREHPQYTREIRANVFMLEPGKTREFERAMAELQQGLWVVKTEERYEPTFSYRWDLLESWLPDLVAEGRKLSRRAALDRLIARYVAGCVYTSERALARLFGLGREEVGAAVARLASRGALVREVTVAGWPGRFVVDRAALDGAGVRASRTS